MAGAVPWLAQPQFHFQPADSTRKNISDKNCKLMCHTSTIQGYFSASISIVDCQQSSSTLTLPRIIGQYPWTWIFLLLSEYAFFSFQLLIIFVLFDILTIDNTWLHHIFTQTDISSSYEYFHIGKMHICNFYGQLTVNFGISVGRFSACDYCDYCDYCAKILRVQLQDAR